jgi:translation initiation factor 2 beta subunit (eIF-2beta)/eIF-5
MVHHILEINLMIEFKKMSTVCTHAVVNITKKARLQEANFRYRRETIRVVHERFAGAVTRIDNLGTIAKQLQCPVKELEYGLVKAVKKTLGINTCAPLTFPGTRDASQFDNILQALIERFVLCPKCELPEYQRNHCAACGYTGGSSSNKDVKKKKTVDKGKDKKEEEDEKDDEEDTKETDWAVELSAAMNTLYDERDCMIEGKLDCHKLNRILDKCWTVTSQKEWNSMKPNICSFLKVSQAHEAKP